MRAWRLVGWLDERLDRLRVCWWDAMKAMTMETMKGELLVPPLPYERGERRSTPSSDS